MAYESDALAGFDEWFGQILAGLAPGERRRAAVKLGQALRRANLQRITANTQPDGSAMEARKPRLDRRGRVRARQPKGRMFPKLRYARMWRIDATPDSTEVALAKGSAVAAQHHWGLRGLVGRTPDGKRVFTRYPARLLLGFAPDDEQLALDVAADIIARR